MLKNMAVVFNSAAGLRNRREELQDACATLRRRGVDIRLVELTQAQPWAEQMRELCSRGYDAIAAAGGDGTVSSIAACLLTTDQPLGVIPTGTVNHFARHLGIPLDTAAALEVIYNGHTELIDVGEVNGVPFLNFSSLGLYADIVVRRVQRQRRGWQNWLTLLLAGTDIVRRYPLLQVCFTKGSQAASVRTPLVFVGNNRFVLGGVDLLQKREDFHSSVLQVACMHDRGRLGILRALLATMFHLEEVDKGFTVIGLQDFHVAFQYPHLPVTIDGEVRRMQPPLHYTMRPQVLRVIVPQRMSQHDAAGSQR